MINLMSHYIRLQFQRLPIIWEKPLVVAETELISELIEQDVPIVLVGSGSSLNAAEAVESRILFPPIYHQRNTPVLAFRILGSRLVGKTSCLDRDLADRK